MSSADLNEVVSVPRGEKVGKLAKGNSAGGLNPKSAQTLQGTGKPPFAPSLAAGAVAKEESQGRIEVRSGEMGADGRRRGKGTVERGEGCESGGEDGLEVQGRARYQGGGLKGSRAATLQLGVGPGQRRADQRQEDGCVSGELIVMRGAGSRGSKGEEIKRGGDKARVEIKESR